MISVTFGAIDKLKADEGLEVYKGQNQEEANKAAYKFIKDMGMEWNYGWVNIIDDNTKIIDFGSHTLFLKEVTT